MRSFKFKKIDAFTDRRSSGNPAGCIYLNMRDDISVEEMQLIARELKGFVNEVVYVFPDEGGYFLKYYSSECEVAFCGHGTLAAMYDCIKNNRELGGRDVISIRVGNERLEIYNRINEEDAIYIAAPEPKNYPVAMKSKHIALKLNADHACINGEHDIDLIDAGLKTLIVPVRSLEECLGMKPDPMELKSFCLENGIDIILVFTQEVSDERNNFRTRVFAPKYGYLEDPATGSGNSAFGYYLLSAKLWHTGRLTIEQNNSHDFPNIVKLRLIKKDDHMLVSFGGKAVVRIEGKYFVPAYRASRQSEA